MMNRFSRIGVLAAALSVTASLAFASPGQGKKAAAPTCPACHMTLTTKKDKVHTVAVKIKGKTYYCCAGCGMNKKK